MQERYECIIEDIIDFGNVLIVRLWNSNSHPNGTDMSKQPINNLYAISKKGEILWNIKDCIHEGRSSICVVHCRRDENSLVINTFMSTQYVMNPLSGQIIGKTFTK
ncbi:hypothetical protein [Aneurinibacillus uraniidurans]|uniref:hypothetical protein n=1 Tax=Aneurinibacillus uraniidurans TaxID=2966586 RepID=UPI0023499713|nr:hypothetical protein [Aneurinibacillus sp. B1]WCN37014.1 hypothetical protein PO771_14285 [Aneurinibacillus sp. B1]